MLTSDHWIASHGHAAWVDAAPNHPCCIRDNTAAKNSPTTPQHARRPQPRLQVVEDLGVEVNVPAARWRLDVARIVELPLVVVAEDLVGLLDVLELGQQLLPLVVVGILDRGKKKIQFSRREPLL